MVKLASEVNEELLIVPISESLLVPCTEAYPLTEFSEDESLNRLYQNLLFNLGQVQKCYRKDEALIYEVNEREEALLDSTREN